MVDSTLRAVVDPVADSLETVREVVTLVDPQGPDAGATVDGATWDDLLARGDEGADLPWEVDDERSTISINYTSGTTGRPKGVQYHHRGAYLNSLGEIVHSYHDPASVYLWTLPMFHCNGWCTPWAITAIGGTHVCLREVRGDAIWALIGEHRVTHLNGAPTVVTTIMNAAEARTLDYALVVTTAGAPPSPTTILEMEKMGFRIVHVYGLTETYGPYTVCQWQEDWRGLEEHERARLQARQGVGMLIAEPVRVVEILAEDVAEDLGGRRCSSWTCRPTGRRWARSSCAATTSCPATSATPTRRRRRSRAAGTTPATWASCTPTATSSCATAPRTSSSPAARTSRPSRSSRPC